MNPKPSILITGSGGFIGSALVNYFSEKGWKVYALLHKIPTSPIIPLQRRGEVYSRYDKDIHYVKYSLEDGIADESIFLDVDYVVHCAYIKNEKAKNAFEVNFKGSKRLVELSRKFDIKRCVFLSSMSAQENSPTVYGKQKFEIEKLFNSLNEIIVRPGLVMGNGGLLKDMIDFIKKRKVIPLVSGGKQPIQTIYIDDLVLAIDKILENNLQGSFTIAEPHAITYKEFYKEVCRVFDLKAKFIPVPYKIFYAAVAFADVLKIQLAVSKDSLKGLKKLKAHDVEDSLRKVEIKPITFDESLDRVKSSL